MSAPLICQSARCLQRPAGDESSGTMQELRAVSKTVATSVGYRRHVHPSTLVDNTFQVLPLLVRRNNLQTLSWPAEEAAETRENMKQILSGRVVMLFCLAAQAGSVAAGAQEQTERLPPAEGQRRPRNPE